MIRPINNANDEAQLKILRTPAQKFDVSISLELLADLIDTANEHKETCAGLASNQIWTNSDFPPPHIFIMRNFTDDTWKPFINATSKRFGKRISSKEGCLSRPNYSKVKTRREFITVTYQDEKGDTLKETYRGLSSIIIQHELDHLVGALI